MTKISRGRQAHLIAVASENAHGQRRRTSASWNYLQFAQAFAQGIADGIGAAESELARADWAVARLDAYYRGEGDSYPALEPRPEI